MFFHILAEGCRQMQRNKKAAAVAVEAPKLSQHMKSMAGFQEQALAWEAAKIAALIAGDMQHAAKCEKEMETLKLCIQNCLRSERERVAGVEPAYCGVW